MGHVPLLIEQLEDGSYGVMTVPISFPLNEIQVSPDQEFVDSRYGRLERGADIRVEDPDAWAGRWHGIQWKREEMLGELEGVRVVLGIGKRLEHGDGIIYYDVRNFTGGQRERYSVILLYPLGEKSSPE